VVVGDAERLKRCRACWRVALRAACLLSEGWWDGWSRGPDQASLAARVRLQPPAWPPVWKPPPREIS